MQVTHNKSEGLKRDFTVRVEADRMSSAIDERLQSIAKQIRLPGFRPGKVPVAHIRKIHGQAVIAEVLEDQVNKTMMEAMEQESLRPAAQPDFDVKSFDEGQDLEYTVSVEVLPEIELGDFSKLELLKETAKAEESQVKEALEELAAGQTAFEAAAKTAKAKDGDAVMVDFVGKIDGEPFENGSAEDQQVVIGSGSFIPGFEEQLVGVKAGDEKVISVTFPEEYGAADLAGKDATFDVTVKEVQSPKDVKVDDELATRLGMEDLDALKARLEENLQAELDSVSRMKVKRVLMDELAEQYSFDVPPGMAEAEFNQIWTEFEADLQRNEQTIEDLDESEDELRKEYQDIAERRVRLGLVLSEVGQQNNIEVEAAELNQAIMREAQRYPGQEQQVFQFFSSNPQAQDQIKAPLYEEKVVDFILELANVTEKTVSRDELMVDPDEEDAPAPKAAAKKKAAKKSAKKAPAKKAAKKSAGKAAKKATPSKAAKKKAAKK